MELVWVVVGLVLVEYMAIALATGRARGRYEVPAPATTGHPLFERHYRVQQNTVEQLVVFLPALFLFAVTVSAPIAALLGLVFAVGRALYARAYVADPARRGTGFVIGGVATAILVVGGLLGALARALF